MRVLVFLLFVVTVVLATSEEEDKKKKVEGCLFNGVVHKSGDIAYEDKTHCLRLRCIRRTNKKGKTKYLLKTKPFKGCRCSVPCPKCSSSWEPVCGTNNKTYVNGCQLWGTATPCGRVQTDLLHQGECGKCPTGCPDIKKPVCGTDNVSYDNECQLLKAACDSSTEIKVAYKVACEDASALAGQSNQCKYNNKKYNLGETIEYLGTFCLEISCQVSPNGKQKKPAVVFRDFWGSRSCECASKDSGNDAKWKYEVGKIF
ncbi:tomoregulin-2-like isoform X1 [Palaemon carinicauda]|uniref:tomoregulin-2-like isoform X1 n=1 Tax=Palaemon carinicauda TaxID=392227 RepID=UPI0035B5EBFA